MQNIKLKEAEMIAQEAKDGNWRKIIELQASPSSEENYKIETLKDVLRILTMERKFSSELIENKEMYSVVLFRYFGIKYLNNKLYFRNKKDAERFVGQYKEMINLYSYFKKEEGEKIAIIKMKLYKKEKVEP